jgi:hypothetical protein
MRWINKFFSKKLTVILVSDTTNEKIDKIKFSKQETKLINQACQITGLTPEQVIRQALESVVAKN